MKCDKLYWVIEMGSRYKFSKEEIMAIAEARRKNKDKRTEQRLKALELRAKGSSAKEVANATGFCDAYIGSTEKRANMAERGGSGKSAQASVPGGNWHSWQV